VIRRSLRLAVLTGVLAGTMPSPAAADFLITPFLGSAFGGDTNIVNFGAGAEKSKLAIGASAAWLSSGIVGFEVDFGYSPRFFEGGALSSLTLPHSRVASLTGNMLLAVPLSVTRESLRPYFVAGIGLLHASTSDAALVLPIRRNLAAIDIGGGAIGFVDPNVGVRFDVRRFSSLASGDSLGPLIGGERLSFWRASVGVTVRY
jgi:hypothetical protein